MTRRVPVDQAKVRELYATGDYSQVALARRFGCARNTIRRMVGRTTDDAWRNAGRPTVTLAHDPGGIFDPGAEFTMASFAFGFYVDRERKNDTITWDADGHPTTRRNGHDTVGWPDGAEFLIGRPGQRVVAVVVDGVVIREDGRYMEPGSSGGAKWLEL